MRVIYNIFLRNWINNRASVEQIEQAVTMNLLTREEATTILKAERNKV